MTLYVRQKKRHRWKEQTVGLWEKARVRWFERIVLKYVYYHMWNLSPVQVRCMRQDAQGWFTEITLRDGMRREVGGSVRMGHVHPWLIHVSIWQKPPRNSGYLGLSIFQRKWFKTILFPLEELLLETYRGIYRAQRIYYLSENCFIFIYRLYHYLKIVVYIK